MSWKNMDILFEKVSVFFIASTLFGTLLGQVSIIASAQSANDGHHNKTKGMELLQRVQLLQHTTENSTGHGKDQTLVQTTKASGGQDILARTITDCGSRISVNWMLR